MPLALVYIDDGTKQVGTGASLPGKMLEGAYVLGKARATVADPGKYPGTGPGVQSQTFADAVYGRPNAVSDSGYFAHK